jgi:hypothetical protein
METSRYAAYFNSDKLPTRTLWRAEDERESEGKTRRTLRLQKVEGEVLGGGHILPFQTRASLSVFKHRSRLQKFYTSIATLQPLSWRCSLANLANPAADIACEAPVDSSQSLKLQSSCSPYSMGPLPASSARLALRQPSHIPSARLSQVQRHFSTTSPVRKEIQDAYILSAARTPTAKVRDYHANSLDL